MKHVEGMMHQLIKNITVVIAENEKCKLHLKKCMDDMTIMETKNVPSLAPNTSVASNTRVASNTSV